MTTNVIQFRPRRQIAALQTDTPRTITVDNRQLLLMIDALRIRLRDIVHSFTNEADIEESFNLQELLENTLIDPP